MNNYKVIGMTCAACSHTVEKAVSGVEGVTSVNVNLLTGIMQVAGDVPADEVIKAVKNAGYKARLLSTSKEQVSDNNDSNKESDNAVASSEKEEGSSSVKIILGQVIASCVILVFLLYFSTGYRVFGYSLPGFIESNSIILYVIEMILAVVAIIINRRFFISGFKSILHRAPNMDALVSLGALASFLYSAVVSIQNIIFYGNMREYIGKVDIYFETSAMILTFVSIGKLIEEMAKGKTTDAISDLTDLTPKTAILMTKDGEKEVPIEEVHVGDTFILKPGMSVPVDGIIKTGTSAVNEASLTGESIPVDKGPGMQISAATINMSGYLTCMATSVGENTAFSHIIQMVTDAANGKVKIARTSDKYSGILIVSVIGIAIVTFVCWIVRGMGFGFALSRAIAVLIISCPCALGIAAPMAIMAGNAVGAKHGILFKTAEALETAGKTQIVVVDKTGTITTGEPKVTDIVSTVKDIEHRDLLLTIAYSLESKSEHPLAKAICDYAAKRYVPMLKTANIEATPGKGIKGDIRIDGTYHTIYAGNESYIANALLGATDDEVSFESDFTQVIHSLVDEGKTPTIFATKNGLLGVIAVADEVRQSSKEAVSLFHKEDIHVVMVTGDRYVTAKAVAEEIGIASEEVLSEVLPQDKADIVTKLKQTGKVAMIGDGINDAPALTCADTGIAIGAGTDVAIDAADVVLVQDNLDAAVDAIRLSRLTLKITGQNLFWALIYNIVGIPLAAGCFYRAFGIMLDPIICALAMTISSLIAILNTLRMFNFKVTTVVETDNDSEEVK